MSRSSFSLASMLVTMATMLFAVQSSQAQDALWPYGDCYEGGCPLMDDGMYGCQFGLCPASSSEPSESEISEDDSLVGTDANEDALTELWQDDNLQVDDATVAEEANAQCISEHDPEYDAAVYGVEEDEAAIVDDIEVNESVEPTTDAEQYGDVYWYDDYANEYLEDEAFEADAELAVENEEVEQVEQIEAADVDSSIEPTEQAEASEEGYAWDEELDDYEYGYWYDESSDESNDSANDVEESTPVESDIAADESAPDDDYSADDYSGYEYDEYSYDEYDYAEDGYEDYELHEPNLDEEATEAVDTSAEEAVEEVASDNEDSEAIADEPIVDGDYYGDEYDDGYWYDDNYDYEVEGDEVNNEADSNVVTESVESEDISADDTYDYEGYGEYEYDYDYEESLNEVDQSEPTEAQDVIENQDSELQTDTDLDTVDDQSYDDWYYGEYGYDEASDLTEEYDVSDEYEAAIEDEAAPAVSEDADAELEADDPWAWDTCNEYHEACPPPSQTEENLPLARLATGCGRQVVIDAARVLDGIGSLLIATSQQLVDLTEQR